MLLGQGLSRRVRPGARLLETWPMLEEVDRPRRRMVGERNRRFEAAKLLGTVLCQERHRPTATSTSRSVICSPRVDDSTKSNKLSGLRRELGTPLLLAHRATRRTDDPALDKIARGDPQGVDHRRSLRLGRGGCMVERPSRASRFNRRRPRIRRLQGSSPRRRWSWSSRCDIERRELIAGSGTGKTHIALGLGLEKGLSARRRTGPRAHRAPLI